MRLSVTAKIAIAFTLVIVAQAACQAMASVHVVLTAAGEARERLTGIGLCQLATSARDDLREDEELDAQLECFAPLAGGLYDADGVLVRSSRNATSLPRRIDPIHAADARAHPGQPVFFAPYSFISENIAVQTIPGPGPVRFVGLSDRYTPRLATKTIPSGVLMSLVLSCVLAIVATWSIAQRVRRGLQRAERVVVRMSAGELDQRLPPLGDDEVGRLAERFNGMANELERTVARLESEQEMRRRSFADWTHEIATPLTSILGYLESLGMERFDADRALRARYVATAHEQALVLKALTDDLSTLSQLDFDGLRLEQTSVDLVALVQSVAQAMRPAARDAGVELRVIAEADEVSTTGDAQRLGQVVTNLASNAIRHSPRGGAVTLRIRERGALRVVEVEDHGEGIAPEHLALLGERFYRPDRSRARTTGGRGLGLAIARGIVTSHGGQMRFASVRGEGTNVIVELPA